MTLSSFNSFLLTKIVKNFRLGSDPRSLIKRHQTLSIIYINFSLVLMILFYEISNVIIGLPYNNIPLIIAPFVAGSFTCLRIGNNDLAALFALAYTHLANGYISHYGFSSLGALGAGFMVPVFSFSMSSSMKVQIINMAICIVQVLGHINNALKIFQITLSQEQNDEISHLVTTIAPCFCFLCIMLIAQKSVENNIWQSAAATHEKTEKINHEIMQAVESKDAFISSLSHEIRNPLNAINGSINFLLQVVKDPQSQQVLQNARISGETLLNLFTNLLDAAKLKSEKMELSYDDTNLYETLKKVLIINCENIRQKRIFVDIFINESIPRIIHSDSARLLQILMNLMSNSIKFSPESGKISIYVAMLPKGSSKQALEAKIDTQSSNSNTPRIPSPPRSESPLLALKKESSTQFVEEFSVEEAQLRSENLKHLRTFQSKGIHELKSSRATYDRNQPWNINIGSQSGLDLSMNQIDFKDYYLKIQISDTGCGIAEENIPKLFEMFTQAHRRVTSSHGGTGLGLWICKQLCQKMGGDIKLYSKINEGTSFVFYLPIRNRDTIELDPSEELEINQRQRPDKPTCLIVDDFSYNRDLYKLLLEREGVQTIVASNGEEAINKYLANLGKLDFILMDVQMPKMDGFTAARKIRELEATNKWKRVDIYFVSGEYYNEQEVMASFRTQSGNSQTLGIQSLKKPIDIEVIGKVVAKYTKKGR